MGNFTKKKFQNKWVWTLVNLFLISGYQNILILLFFLPIIVALQFNNTPLGLIDYTATGLRVFFIIYETIVDQQQCEYQSKKHALKNSKQELTATYKKSFLDKVLLAYSRHLNYWAEQGSIKK